MARSTYTVLPQSESDLEKDAALLAIDSGSSRRSRISRICSICFLLRLCKVLLGRLFVVLTPSFFHRHPGRNSDHRPVDNNSTALPHDRGTPSSHSGSSSSNNSNLSTAWLDGIRGVASFCVFLFHYCKFGHPNIKIAYGGSDEQWSIFQLPIIRLVVHGRTMVSLFFIVSGYALSFSALKLIRKRDYDTLARRLSSSVFRRGIRLMLPSFVAAFMHYGAQRLGLTHSWYQKSESTFSNDTAAFLAEFSGLMNPFTWTTEVPYLFYGPQLWTIPIEFRASMFLFITLLGLARATTAVRLATVASLGVYAMARQQWDISLFMAGVLLADVNLIAHSRRTMAVASASAASAGPSLEMTTTTSSSSSSSRRVRRLAKKAALISLLVFGLYVASYPTQKAYATNVYKWLAQIGPSDTDFKSRIWTSLGAALSVTAVSFMPRCQRVFETRAVAYMGRISYALYLTHYLLNELVGRPLIRLMWGFFGTDDWVHYEGGWLLATVLYVPLVIWVADVFWRVVDVKSVELARNIEKWCVVA